MSVPNNTFSEMAAVMRSAKRIGIASHIRPDGDAIGSLLGLALSLRLEGKQVIPLSNDGVPWNLAFLPGTDQIVKPAGDVLELDLAISVDTASKERVGPNSVIAMSAAKKSINIDHHGSNPRYADLNYIDSTAPAVGQILYDFLSAENFPMDDAVRQNLFAAISTDTGSFQFPSTTARTHQIAAEMINAGLDTGALASKLYDQHPMRRVELLRAMLNEMQFRKGQRIVSWNYTQAAKKQLNVQQGDTEGLIDHLRAIDTVVAAVIFEEQKDGNIRISARSKSDAVNVAEVCGRFGGGGHRLAAGATLPGPITAAAETYLNELENEVG
ncbi:MAG: bifunctional oligoribonuclease/PAP phosphatase NrnA [Verrucomicrobiaceae bacterium]|nr:bifunctional oligoribonuclease/PAP phosphatase NrnA [Verrucomicrobiaceae bacterium]